MLHIVVAVAELLIATLDGMATGAAMLSASIALLAAALVTVHFLLQRFKHRGLSAVAMSRHG